MPDDQRNQRWNLFAAILEDILFDLKPPLALDVLDDRADPVTHEVIHKEKVRRLKKSLRVPKEFPILLPEEIERVERTYQLQPDDSLRLRAAVLATAIEEELMDRIVNEDARKAAWDIYPIICNALQLHSNQPGGLGAVKGNVLSDLIDDSTAQGDFDLQFSLALKAIDHGSIALSLSNAAVQSLHKQSHAQDAFTAFSLALSLLGPVNQQQSLEWAYWYNTALDGMKVSQQLKN